MREFLYLAIDPDGQRRSGELEASDVKKAISILQAQKLTVLEVTPVKEKHWIFLFFQPVKGPVLAMFIRQLGVMLTAGIPLAPALRSLVPEGGPAHYQKALARLCQDVESGFYLSQGFELTRTAPGRGVP